MKIVCVKAIQSFDVGLAVVVRSSTAICCHRVSVCRHAFMAKCTMERPKNEHIHIPPIRNASDFHTKNIHYLCRMWHTSWLGVVPHT